MQFTGAYLKQAAAAVLLCLFAFILVEKNAHGHSPVSKSFSENETTVQAAFNCGICDFQIAADADVPQAPVTNGNFFFSQTYTVTLPLNFSGHSISRPAERGPPALPAVIA